MSISANELRVGNLLKDYKHKLQYVEMHTIDRYDHTQCKVTEHIGGYVYECSLEDLRPIKLTPEILEKAGFKVLEDAGNWHHEGFIIYRVGGLMLGYSQEKFYWYDQVEDDMFSEMRPCILYVHELQNLHFILTGTELNIEL